MPTLNLHGMHPTASGAGVFHLELARSLKDLLSETGWNVNWSPTADGSFPGTSRRYMTRLAPADCTIMTGTPMPIRVGTRNGEMSGVVFDVRWLANDRLPKKAYRAAELARLVRRASHLFTISETVAAQLSALGESGNAIVLPMGPGQFEGFECVPPSDTKTVVLIGSASHKRNEELAQLLSQSALIRSEFKIIGVGLTHRACSTLTQAVHPTRIRLVSRVDADQLAGILSCSSAYLSLSLSEGFGLPYVEAAYFGCDVIAPSVPIVREVLFGAGNLLPSVHPSVADIETALLSWDARRIAELQSNARARHWSKCAEVVAKALSII